MSCVCLSVCLSVCLLFACLFVCMIGGGARGREETELVSRV